MTMIIMMHCIACQTILYSLTVSVCRHTSRSSSTFCRKIVIYSKCEIIMVGSARRHMVTTVSSVCRMVVAVNLPKTFQRFQNNQPHALLIFVHISNDLIDFYSVASPIHSFVHQRSVCSFFISFIVFVQVAWDEIHQNLILTMWLCLLSWSSSFFYVIYLTELANR